MYRRGYIIIATLSLSTVILFIFLSKCISFGTKRRDIAPSALSDGYNLTVFEANLDSNGVPTILSSKGASYNPSRICRYGLYVAARYHRDGKEGDLQKIKNVMNWVTKNKIEKRGFITWELLEDVDSFHIKAPWTSALTNSWCAGALLQGYVATGDRTLELDARKALEFLFIPVEDGGGLSVWEDGDIWFEEYPSVENPSHVLNGFIYAIDILDMFHSYYNDKKYDSYYERAMSSLRNKVASYDVDYGSIYDNLNKGNKLGMSYHKIHYKQLYYAYQRTKDEHFRDLSKKWFELQMQSTYSVDRASPSLDGAKYGQVQLNDGKYWYAYWLAKSPAEITFSFDKPYTVKAINIFSLPGSLGLKSVDIYYKQDDGKFVSMDQSRYELVQRGYNNSNGNETVVFLIKLTNNVRTDRIMLTFTSDSGKVTIREVGFHKEMDDEYNAEMEKYSYVKYISDLRDRLQ